MAVEMATMMSRSGRVLKERSVSLFTGRKAAIAADMFVHMKLANSRLARWEHVHKCMANLWLNRDVVPQLEQLYRLDPDLIHSVLPQCCHYLLHAPHTAAARSLERFLLASCASSPQFAFEFYWLLLAQPPSTAKQESLPRSQSHGLLPVPEPNGAGAEAPAGATGSVGLSPAPGKAMRIERLLKRVRAAAEHARYPLPNGDYRCDLYGAEESQRDAMGPELGLIQTLTTISDRLRFVDRAQRTQRLRASLASVNENLPAPPSLAKVPSSERGAGCEGGATASSAGSASGGSSMETGADVTYELGGRGNGEGGSGIWRPFLPLVAPGEADHRLLRFYENEAIVLSTKERVPYLVFAEVQLSERQNPLYRLPTAESAAAAAASAMAAATAVATSSVSRAEANLSETVERLSRMSRKARRRTQQTNPPPPLRLARLCMHPLGSPPPFRRPPTHPPPHLPSFRHFR